MKTKFELLDDPLEDDGRDLEAIIKFNSYISISFILLGIYLIYDSASLYYCYNYTDINFIMMKSNLELGGEFAAGFFSIFCGVFCWMRYPFGLESLYFFGIMLIIFSLILTLSDLEFIEDCIFTAGPFFLSGLVVIGYSRWKKLKWIYRK